jgi:hypothetical protein
LNLSFIACIDFLVAGIVGGLTEALSGLPGFFVIHLFDKGFKQYFGNLLSFLDALTALEVGVGGRVRHFLPADSGDDWYDRIGQSHPPPVTPPNLDRGKLLWEVQANSTRAFCTAHRWVAEANFGRDWGCKMTGSRGEIPQQLLEPYNKRPTPQVPQIYVVNAVHHQLVADFATPVREVYELPQNVSHADIGRQMLERLELLNWLDPLRTGAPSPFNRQNIFSKPTLLELRQGFRQQNQGVMMVNCLDPNQTHFPRLSTAELNEFCAGSYLAGLAPSYVSSYRHKELERNQAYLNLATYHQNRSQLSQTIDGWMFDQVQPPRNWYGVWPGRARPNTTPWQPVRILVVAKIPSRYTSSQSHTAVLAFVPDNWPLVIPAPGFKSQANQRIQMFICGPRMPGKCKVGARTCSCCAHVATAVYICGVLAHNHGLFRTKWRNINYLDAGAGRAPAHTTDILTGLAN